MTYAVTIFPSVSEKDAVTVPALLVEVGVLILAKLISVFLMVEVLVLFVLLLTIYNRVSAV